MVFVLSSVQVTPRMCQLQILRCQRVSLPRNLSTMSQSHKLMRKFNIGVQNGSQLQNTSLRDSRMGLSSLEEILKAVAATSSKRFYSTVQTRQPKDVIVQTKSDLHLRCPKVLGVLNIHDGSRVVLSVIHCRSFKTARGIAAEVERNPSFGERLRNFFGGSSSTKITFPAAGGFKDMDDARVGMAYARGLAEGREQTPISKKFSFISWFLAGVLFGVVSLGAKQFLSPFVNKNVPVVKTNVTFDDVKGCAEAKEELWDIVKFLQNPQSFNEVGGNLPKGVLLTGPPGSGKTLLARAVAGEANVPFFYASCSSFDEILVGEGARRVRALFAKAKEMAPCVIFLDELDSVGGKRTAKSFHPYADQTINQLLTEMDGFVRNSGVMVLGATNRHDVLDSALLRPGRFDTVIKVGLPNDNDRKEILEYYLSKINCSDIDVGKLVRITTSYSPASLENLVNQAAIRAVAAGSKVVTMAHMMESFERLQIGPAKKEPVLKEKSDLKKVAYHECGHALTNIFTEGSAPLFKVTIKQTTSTLGHALYMRKMVPNTTKTDYMNQIYTALGGRAAEEVMIGPESITSGCLSDMQGATNLARGLVTNGLSPSSLVIHDPEEKYSNEYLQKVDEEVDKILVEAYEHVKALLLAHKEDVEKVANALVEKKTLSAEEVYSILGIPLPEELKNINTEEKFSSTKVKETWDGGVLGVDGRLNQARLNDRVPVQQRPLPAS